MNTGYVGECRMSCLAVVFHWLFRLYHVIWQLTRFRSGHPRYVFRHVGAIRGGFQTLLEARTDGDSEDDVSESGAEEKGE